MKTGESKQQGTDQVIPSNVVYKIAEPFQAEANRTTSEHSVSYSSTLRTSRVEGSVSARVITLISTRKGVATSD
jgi:hypothetical protein